MLLEQNHYLEYEEMDYKHHLDLLINFGRLFVICGNVRGLYYVKAYKHSSSNFLLSFGYLDI